MYRSFRRSPLRGGFYHLSLIFVTAATFNFGFHQLTGVNIAERIFAGMAIPQNAIAVGLCVAAVMVLWNNWID